jgi:hypothetical protein
MKGTFFSADFIRDKNDNLRLIEINTDTGIVQSQAYTFDWTDFISVLSNNSITNVNVVYKYDIQYPIVKSLSDSLTANAPFITGFTETIIPGDSIFPTTPVDSESTFILRMAYDETAILDSEYAKGTLNLLTLFADAEDSESVIGFYHSSSFYGNYNTLDTTLTNPSNVPDFITKTVVEEMLPHKFYKLGGTGSDSDKISGFITNVTDDNDIIEQYHISSQNVTNNVATSIRSFQIAYGSNIDLCYVSQYEIDASFNIPSEIEFDNNTLVNLIPSKHYYEFATNHIKNQNMGFLGFEKVQNLDGSFTEIENVVLDETLVSYYVDGAPNTDDFDVLRQWSISGGTLPAGSYLTSSFVANKFSTKTYANDMVSINFDGGAQLYIGGETRVLAYDMQTDSTRYVKVLDLDTYDAIFAADGSHTEIFSIDCVIFDEPQDVYIMDMQEIHNFILETNGFMALLVVHNALSCFAAGTEITLEGGTKKNIEDMVIGDEVLSFNESSLTIEPKKVIGMKQPIHQEMVKYHFSNDTTVTSTFDHPFYTNGLGLSSFMPEWTNKRYDVGKNVEKIKVGDLVRLATGGQTAIKEIEVLPYESVQTYIIEVEDNHNFFANNILVHNK